jgi:putative holliday junction resolvase
MNPDNPFLLCLDYGTAKVGVAVGSLVPSTPLDVIRYGSRNQLLREVQKVVQQERPEGILLGWPADHLTISTKQTEVIRAFGDELGRLTSLPVIYYPETLTTQQATKKMIAAGVSMKRRREMEDSFAAAAILDSYLEGLN